LPAGSPYRDVGTGVLLGLTFLLRQLSGVLLVIAVMTFILLEPPREAQTGGRRLARTLIIVMACGLAGYLAKATDVTGWLLFGVWPFMLLGITWRRTAVAARPLATTIGHLLLGTLVAGLPLVVYHLAHHSLGAWLTETFIGAAEVTRLEFMRSPGYTMAAILGWRGLLHGGAAERLNGLFWLTLLAAAAVVAILTLRGIARGDRTGAIHPLPVIALAYSLVSVHYQVTLYLFYSAGLSLVAVLWLTSGRGAILRACAIGGVAALAAIGLYYQAGMPLSRGLRGTVAGTRAPVNTLLDLPRGGIYVEASDARRYESAVSLIHKEAGEGEAIFAFPDNAELYFLAERPNPFKFFNTALGIRSDRDLESVLAALKCRPPKLVFYDPDDKYNTPFSRRIAAAIRATYDSLPPLPPFEVYRARPPVLPAGPAQAACHAPGGA
jgi:hypothetical protein